MDLKKYIKMLKEVDQKVLKGLQEDKSRAKKALQNKNNLPKVKKGLEKILKNRKYPHMG
ncbi:MAG: hypothetical protein KAS99_02045 [Candidatus Omnitrophica bacterium]|nr:hypothetical protein [Candidatus Omnitrophota bacterium]